MEMLFDFTIIFVTIHRLFVEVVGVSRLAFVLGMLYDFVFVYENVWKYMKH